MGTRFPSPFVVIVNPLMCIPPREVDVQHLTNRRSTDKPKIDRSTAVRQVSHIQASVGDRRRSRGGGRQAKVKQEVLKLWPLVSGSISTSAGSYRKKPFCCREHPDPAFCHAPACAASDNVRKHIFIHLIVVLPSDQLNFTGFSTG